ncbi:MAG: hypothetical protein SOY42_10450 [Clostridium sp.]|nr:hypothetical protein [Clostridium sp.]
MKKLKGHNNSKLSNKYIVPKLFNCGGKGKKRVIKNRYGVIIDLKNIENVISNLGIMIQNTLPYGRDIS